jgi:hypothetical protein
MSGPEAKATFADRTRRSISITIGGEPQTLSVGDCVSFNRVVKEGEDPYTIAKIISFGNNHHNPYINRIFYEPWRVAEKRWATPSLPSREIGLEQPYLSGNGGDWTTLVKLAKCPDQNGGKRKTLRSKRKTRRR